MDVFGCLLAVLGLMNLPVIDERMTVFVFFFVAVAIFEFSFVHRLIHYRAKGKCESIKIRYFRFEEWKI